MKRMLVTLAFVALGGCQGVHNLVPTATALLPNGGFSGAVAANYLFAIPSGQNEVRWGKYPYPGNTLPKMITNGLSQPDALAAAPDGEIFVANEGNGTVTGYASPLYSGKAPGTLLHTIRTLLPTGSSTFPIAMRVDTHNDLFVLVQYNVINEYAPPQYHQVRSFTLPGTVLGFFAIGHGVLFAATPNGTVVIWVPPKYAVKTICVPSGCDYYYYGNAVAIALDANRNLYAADGLKHVVYVYAAFHYLKNPVKTFTYGPCCSGKIGVRMGDQNLLASASSDVYLVLRDKIVQYASPDYTQTTVIKNGKTDSALIDGLGNLVVTNNGPAKAGGISLYHLPSGTLYKTISATTTFTALASLP
jgi:hypothetical protein